MSHLRRSFPFWLVWPCLVFAFDYIQWECSGDAQCQGQWRGLEDFQTCQKNYTLSIKKQRFNLKIKEMQGENFDLESRDFLLRAPRAVFLYDSEFREWSFPQGVFGKFRDVYWEGKEAFYLQKKHFLEAKNIEILFLKTGFVGQAEELEYSQNSVFLKNIHISQCPKEKQSWSLRADSLSYSEEDELLVIDAPKIFFYDYQLLSFEEFVFDNSAARHALRNVPSLSLSTGSGITLKNPIRWNTASQSIELSPQVNSKNGLGADLKLQKNNFFAEGFVEFGGWADESIFSWLAKTSYQEKLGDLFFGYDVALVSDDQFYYRYPFLAQFWRDRYLPSQAWIEKNTSYGQFRIFSEKLQRTAQSKNLDTDVSEYLFQAQWTQAYQGTQSLGFDVIHRYQDRTYHRFKLYNTLFLGHQIDFSQGLSFYTQEQGFNGFAHAQVPLYALSTPIGEYQWFYIGQKSLNYGPRLLIDVIAQPVSVDFLYNAHKHHGLDWGYDGQWIVTQWNMAPTDLFEIQSAIAYTWEEIEAPWSAPAQPYLTAFRKGDAFSPLSLRIFNTYADFSVFIDLKRSEIISLSSSTPVYKDAQQSLYLSSFYHKYYPSNALSTQVSAVSQLHLGYTYRSPQSWFFESSQRYDLTDIRLDQAAVAFGYEDCCWAARWDLSAAKEYNPEKLELQWSYKMGVHFELKSSGLYQKADGFPSALSSQEL